MFIQNSFNVTKREACVTYKLKNVLVRIKLVFISLEPKYKLCN